MTVETGAARIKALRAALVRTLDGRWTSPWWNGPAVHRASMADYLAERGGLAAEAGQLADLFRELSLQEQPDQAGSGASSCSSSACP